MANSGWICPKCSHVYAPFMMECQNCNRISPNSPMAVEMPQFTPAHLTDHLVWCHNCGRLACVPHICLPPYTLSKNVIND